MNKKTMSKILLVSIFLSVSSVFALMRPQVLEIDGQQLSVRESMDLILWRTENSAIAEFKKVKHNGSEMIPYVLYSGQTIFVRAEDGNGDTKSYDEKQRSNQKTAISCNVHKAIVVPNGTDIVRSVNLLHGQAVFQMVYDDVFKINNKSVTMFFCQAAANQGQAPRVNNVNQVR